MSNKHIVYPGAHTIFLCTHTSHTTFDILLTFFSVSVSLCFPNKKKLSFYIASSQSNETTACTDSNHLFSALLIINNHSFIIFFLDLEENCDYELRMLYMISLKINFSFIAFGNLIFFSLLLSVTFLWYCFVWLAA